MSQECRNINKYITRPRNNVKETRSCGVLLASYRPSESTSRQFCFFSLQDRGDREQERTVGQQLDTISKAMNKQEGRKQEPASKHVGLNRVNGDKKDCR